MPGEKKEGLEEEATHILEECRMVLPGIQAIFGFQLIAFFNEAFAKLDVSQRAVHLAATVLTALAIGAVLSIAAYHRMAEPHQVTPFFTRMGSTLLSLGMFMLAAGMSMEFFLVTNIALRGLAAGIVVASVVFVLIVAGWFAAPNYTRLRNSRRRQRG